MKTSNYIVIIVVVTILTSFTAFSYYRYENTKSEQTYDVPVLDETFIHNEDPIYEDLSRYSTPPSNPPTPHVPSEFEDKKGYDIEHYWPTKDGRGFSDARLVYYVKGNKKKIVTESVYESILEFQNEDPPTLFGLSFPENSTNLYFTSGYYATDAGVFGIYSYDVASKLFERLSVSEYHQRWGGHLSPDGLRLTSIAKFEEGNTQNLYILDLANDKVKTVVTLPDSETLNDGLNWAGDMYVRWIDNSTVEYGVFSPNTAVGYGGNTLIEMRNVDVSDM